MPDVVTISQAVERARSEGFPVSEYCLRRWVKQGKIPVRRVGAGKQLLYYPALVRFVTCEDGGDIQPVHAEVGIRPLLRG